MPTYTNKGCLGHFGLYEWWEATFTESERRHFVYIFNTVERPVMYSMRDTEVILGDDGDGESDLGEEAEVSQSESAESAPNNPAQYPEDEWEGVPFLTTGECDGTYADASEFLTYLADCFCTTEEESLKKRILQKAAETRDARK